MNENISYRFDYSIKSRSSLTDFVKKLREKNEFFKNIKMFKSYFL